MFLSKIVKKGVQTGAEYREHRKEVKLSRENSQQNVEQRSEDQNVDQFLAPQASSQPPSRRTLAAAGPSDAPPPAYTEVAGRSDDRSIASGGTASDDKKAALAQYEENEYSSDDDLSTEDDEADWELDEALDLEESAEAPPDYQPVDTLVQDVLSTARRPADLPANFECTPLPCPVIIPQRRPRKKERGFIRAYAPLLGECSGISQETFLTFLKNFHRSSQASPIWPIIQISAAIAGLAPSVIAMAVTNAVQVAAGAAKEVQTRHRTNDFLDKINEEVFKPRGLFAMIVKYKTSAEVARSENSVFRKLGVGSQQVDFSTGQAVAKYDRSLSGEHGSGEHKSMSDRMQNIRLASGTTRGAVELPEAAPLVFPAVDRAVATDGPETFKDKARDAKLFLADYLDRRAQMEYSKQDPNSSLGVPEEQRKMKSTLADPNHPMYNSGLVGLVSGGKLSGGRGGRSRSYGYNSNASRPSIYDSSRLYSSSELPTHRDVRRHDKRERRALRTEQRMADGRRVSRKRERRYEDFLYQQESIYGGDAGFGVGRGRRGMGRRGGSGGPIGMLLGAASAAMDGGRGQSQSSSSNPLAPHAPYGGQPQDPYARAPSQAGHYGASQPAPYAAGGRPRRQRGQKGGALGMVKRVMQEDVLYLMIVNMPSEAELAEAREAIAAAKAGK